jgi:hypothetical protein
MSKPLKRLPIVLASVALAVLTPLVLASPAAAHDPIFLTEDQMTPETGPYLPDGTISFALYGSLYEPGETRGFEFDLRDGDDLYLSLLIPDLEPELSLPDDDLPELLLIAPDGAERPFNASVREPFADPFSGTNYVTLLETQEPAVGGRYQVIVTGDAASRFVVAVGTSEEFFTPTERAVDRPTSFPGIAEPLNVWYTTPADGSEPANAAAGGDGVDVDEELIEEELAKLDEEAAEPAASDASASNPDTSASDSNTSDSNTSESEQEVAATVGGDEDDGGSAMSWVAPAVLAVAVVAGGTLAVRRRRSDA